MRFAFILGLLLVLTAVPTNNAQQQKAATQADSWEADDISCELKLFTSEATVLRFSDNRDDMPVMLLVEFKNTSNKRVKFFGPAFVDPNFGLASEQSKRSEFASDRGPRFVIMLYLQPSDPEKRFIEGDLSPILGSV